MSESVITALITGVLALIGVIISNFAAAKKTEAALNISLAVMQAKLEELTREVREHNGFARRMPVVEEQIKNLNRRIMDLENKIGG